MTTRRILGWAAAVSAVLTGMMLWIAACIALLAGRWS